MTTVPTTAERARELWESGMDSHAEIARCLGVTRQRVGQVLGSAKRPNVIAACRELQEELERPIVAVLDPMRDPVAGFRHGESHGHQYHGCRCWWCLEALRRYARHEARAKWLRGEHHPTHGKASTYNVYGCRCRACTDAHARRHRERRREARSA